MDNKTFDELLLPVRNDIDRIDKQLLQLFIERMQCSERVAEIKRSAGIPVLNAAREQVILDRVKEKAGEYGEDAVELYKAIMAISRARQEKMLESDKKSSLAFEQVKTEEQIALVAEIAEPIWYATYEPIIGADAVAYMIDKFQSVPAIHRQLREEGYVYYLIYADEKPVGFIGVVPHKDGKMFLSKLYVQPEYRGRGIPRAAFAFISDLSRKEGLNKIYLTVNKYNTHAIDVYKHHGFYEIDAVVTDIGCGYVMDDFILQKDV